MASQKADTGRVVGFNHFNVSTVDIEASLRFWQELLGLNLIGRGRVSYEHLDRIVNLDETMINWAELSLPTGGLIEIFEYESPRGQAIRAAVNDHGATHICLEVEDIEQLAKRLSNEGIQRVSEGPVEIPFGDWQGYKSMYIRDPDGVYVELVERPKQLAAEPQE